MSGGGRGSMATIVGLVLVALAALAVMIAIAVVVSGQSTSVFDLQTGDCFVLPIDGDDTSFDQVEPVACSEPHDAEVFATGQLNPDQDRDYPTDEMLFGELDARCAVGSVPAQFGRLPVGPNEASWDPLGGRFICVAVPFGGDLVSAPIAEF